MKQNEIKDLTDKELRTNLTSENINFSKMKLSHAVSPLENPMKLRASKKTIARIKTELKSRLINKLDK